ncbi:MAG: N-acetylmuramoyl-L-alanine amidase [Deltaproteobacteria bacterium]|nr:N-acetylmuramoyl-L-alanine amidase [Deltaproteobacteria bacterium]
MAAGVGLGALALAGAANAQPDIRGSGIVDRRAFAQLTDETARHTRARAVEDVYALVLHQMGFSRGSDPGRYDRVTAHYLVLPDGRVYQLHDHDKRLPAASGLNTGSVSVEFAGNLPSRARSTDPKHYWSPDSHGMDQLTPAQVAGGRMLVDTLYRQGWLTHILAHRQGGPGRGLDPGPDIWREVGAWAVRQYGLDWGGPDFAVSGGSPIPAHWWGAVS